MLVEISEGGEFDTTDAIRALAKEILLLKSGNPNMQDKSSTPTTSHIFYQMFNSTVAAALLKNRYYSIECIQGASDSDLQKIAGIGPQTLAAIRKATERGQ